MVFFAAVATRLRNPSGRVGATGRSFLGFVPGERIRGRDVRDGSIMRNLGIETLLLVLIIALGAPTGWLAADSGVRGDLEPLDAFTLLHALSGADEDSETPPPSIAYGDRGSARWSIGGLLASDFQRERILAIRGGVEWFPIDAFSIGLDADLGWVGQDAGDDAGFVGVSVMLRWHFLRRASWSIYADLGIGLVHATSPVPPDGSRLDFTPQAGLGCSIALGDRARLLLGLGWYHLSNARTTDTNFGIDALAVSARVSLPF